MIEEAEQKDDTMIIILVISILALILSLIILFPVIKKVNSTKEEVLSLFLDIPKRTVRILSLKCTRFQTSLQDEGDNDSMESEQDSLAMSEEDEDNDSEILSYGQTPTN